MFFFKATLKCFFHTHMYPYLTYQVYSGNADNVQYQVYEDKLYLTKPELDLHNHPIIIS